MTIKKIKYKKTLIIENLYRYLFFINSLITPAITIENAGRYGRIKRPPPVLGVKYHKIIARTE